jgi:hypothetical protein
MSRSGTVEFDTIPRIRSLVDRRPKETELPLPQALLAAAQTLAD